MNKKEISENRHYWVDLYKKSHGCDICGYNKHPSALCFDHLPQFEKAELTKNGCSKRTNAGGMYRLYDANIPLLELIDEIKKCRILCSNCHMEVTHHKNTRANMKISNQISIDSLEEILYTLESKQLINK